MLKRSATLSKFFIVGTALVLAGGVLTSANWDDDDDQNRFTFALWGDTPYSDVEKTTLIPALIDDVNRSNVAFSVFDGDIKSGSARCEEPVYSDAIARFNTFDRPMIYVPGDNEWTDCHRISNGGKNALAQLAYIRTTMFASAESFGRQKLLLDHQGLGPDGVTSYPENTRWTYQNVVFVGLNVPGSNNNEVHPGQCTSSKSARSLTDCDDDNHEYANRDAANLQFLRESFDVAMTRHAAGVVVVIQADPSFDLPETETDNERTCVRAGQGECLDNAPDGTPPSANLANYDGYDAFLAALRSKTVEFGTIGGQVVLVHGDTHFFKVDKPLDSPTSLRPNFTRVCTFGSPGVNWVKVTVNPKSRNLFTFEPMIVPRS